MRSINREFTNQLSYMKKETLKKADYKQPLCEILNLPEETSYMLTSSSIESGKYEEEEW